MASRRICVAFLWLVLATHAIAAPQRVDRKAWTNDYTVLKHTLEQRYANLAWFASPQGGVDLPALDRRTQRALAVAETDAEAKGVLLAFVAAFHDGHFSVLATREPATGTSTEPAKPALDTLDASAGCAALGYAITRSTAYSLPFESLAGFELEADGVKQPFRAGIATTSGGQRIGIVRIAYFRQTDFPTLCEQAWSSVHPPEAVALRKAVDAAWFETLAARLRHFTEEHVTAVIVDVGDTPGGNDAGDWSARLFSAKPVHSAPLWMAAADDARGYADEELDGLRKALAESPPADADTQQAFARAIADFERRKSGVETRHCDLSWAWRTQRVWNPAGCSRLVDMGFASGAVDYLPPAALGGGERAAAVYWPAVVDAQRGAWSGPVYVLTSAKTYSAAEMFSAVMRDNGVARTVGVATGGDGCGFMQESEALTLPHSRLRLRIPDCVRLRADGSDEVAGIKPDLPVLPTEGESERARAARVLATIASDLSR